MKRITQEQWDNKPDAYKGVWTTERTDWEDWEEVRHKYMGKRTMLDNDNGATVLLVEGLSFEIIK